MSERRSHLFGTFFALAWLVMLGYNVAATALRPPGLGEHAEVFLGALAAFVAIYIWYWTRVVYAKHTCQSVVFAAGAMVVLNFALILVAGPDGANGLSYNFIYVVVVLAYGLPWRAGVVACFVVAALAAGVNLLFRSGVDGTTGVTVLVFLIGLGMVGVREMREASLSSRTPATRWHGWRWARRDCASLATSMTCSATASPRSFSKARSLAA